MRDKGIAHIGIGSASGENKCSEAMQNAISSPLLETSIEGATHVLIQISGDVSLVEANEAVDFVRQQADPNANIIFGTAYHENSDDVVTITVIATGVKDRNIGHGSRPAFRPDKTEMKKPVFNLPPRVEKKEIMKAEAPILTDEEDNEEDDLEIPEDIQVEKKEKPKAEGKAVATPKEAVKPARRQTKTGGELNIPDFLSKPLKKN